jgi:hypothetical protein
MANFKTLIPLLLLSLVLKGFPAEAGYRKPQKAASEKPQIPFSFITPSQPSHTLTRMQSTLQGRVEEEREIPPTQPVYTQVFLPAPQPTITPAQAPPPKNQLGSKTTPSKRARSLNPDYPERSWVSDLTVTQALPLAANIAAFLAGQFDPATTTLLLAMPHKKQLNNPLTPELETQLRQAGFTLAHTQSEAPQAQRIRYQVSVMGSGILVQLETSNQWASRYYPFTPTQALMVIHPFSIRTLGGTNP